MAKPASIVENSRPVEAKATCLALWAEISIVSGLTRAGATLSAAADSLGSLTSGTGTGGK